MSGVAGRAAGRAPPSRYQHDPTPSYRAQLHYSSERKVAFFMITNKGNKELGVRTGPESTTILPEQSKITLDIPRDGIELKNGWSITPDIFPVIELVHVRRKGAVFRGSLSVKWTRPKEQPVKLVHRMKLLGAKDNFVILEIDPPHAQTLEDRSQTKRPASRKRAAPTPQMTVAPPLKKQKAEGQSSQSPERAGNPHGKRAAPSPRTSSALPAKRRKGGNTRP